MPTIVYKILGGLLLSVMLFGGGWLESKSHYLGQYDSLVAATNQAASDQKAADAKINQTNQQADQNELATTKALLATATADRDSLLSSSTKVTSGPVSKTSCPSNAVVTNSGSTLAGTSAAPSAVQPDTNVSTLSEQTLSAVIDTGMDNISYLLSVYDWNDSIAK